MSEPLLTRAETVRLAALWFLQQQPKPTPVVPALQSKFDLSPLEAVEAIRQATLMAGRAQ